MQAPRGPGLVGPTDRGGGRGYGSPQSFPSQIPRRCALERGRRSRRTSGSGAQAPSRRSGARGTGQSQGRELRLGGHLEGGARRRAAPAPWASQSGQIRMHGSALRACTSPLPSGRSDSRIWDSEPVQAEVTKLPPSVCCSPGPGSRQGCVQVVRGERAFEPESVFLVLGPTGHSSTKPAPTPADSGPPGEVSERPTSRLALPGKPRGLQASRLEQLHTFGPAQLPKAGSSWGATALPAPRTSGGAGWPSGRRFGPPREPQTEALGAGGRGGRRGAQHVGGEAQKPFKDPDYFPLNEKQQQQQQLLPPCASAPPPPSLASGDPRSEQLSLGTVNTAQLPQLSPHIKVPGVRGNLNI